jgi:hypothetical protein
VKRKKPYLQGALDSLCAVYGIVNSAKIISNISEEESRDLFNKILLYLEEKNELSKALINGITIGLVGSILRDIAADKIPDRIMPFKNKSDITFDLFWYEISKFLENKNRAVLMAINGNIWDHWSVVSNISDTKIFFFDSLKLKSFLRSRCTIGKPTKSRPHLLCPHHTYFLSREGNRDE